jgi:glycosyltransferase involved in cell wall biosynthesis
MKRLIVKKDYKEVFDIASRMAVVRRDNPEKALRAFEESIEKIFEILLKLLVHRAEKSIKKIDQKSSISDMSIEQLVERFEMPSHFRELFDERKGAVRTNLQGVNLSEFFDNLSFPFLSSSVILSAFFTSARVMYKSRPLLNEFARAHKVLVHPERTLWLTDTLEDSNGVAMVLKSMLYEIRKRNLPIDILTASNTLQSGDHLIVVKPVGEYRLSFYEQQPLRIPNLLEIHKIFQEGEYSRIICSTEGPMGLAALYLKNAYSVPAYFYVHTDWMMFAERVLKFNEENKSRLRRLLRAFYKGFDGLFVLNNDQRKWLIGKDMGFNPESVFLTAHWADEGFEPKSTTKRDVFGVDDDSPVLLFAGRLSDEKGVMEIPRIMQKVWKTHPSAKIAFAGMGPKEKELKEVLPDAIFLGWVDHHKLPEIYSAADMLILPSRFDTFGCVVLEALSCGIPVAAYNTKGPKDIIIDSVNGYLAKDSDDIAAKIIKFLGDAKLRRSFKKEALKRARQYDVEIIINRFLRDLGSAA